MIVRAASSHEPSQATMRPSLTAKTTAPRRERRRGTGSEGATRVRVSTAVSSDTGGSSGSGDLDLVAEAVPHVAVDLGELRREPDLLDLPRARQVDRDGVLDGAGAGGHDDDPVGQADRLGEVVGDEDD